MIKIKWIYKTLLFIALIGINTIIIEGGQQLPYPFKVIPQPREVELLSCTGLKFGELKCMQLIGDFTRPITGAILSDLPQIETDSCILSLQLVESQEVPQSPEGYVLIISKGNVKITSRGRAGLFYGCQTLVQLLEDARDIGVNI